MLIFALSWVVDGVDATSTAITRSGAFFKNNIDVCVVLFFVYRISLSSHAWSVIESTCMRTISRQAEELHHPVMDVAPVIQAHPWLFVYAAGVVRAVGFYGIVWSSQMMGYTVSMILFVSAMVRYHRRVIFKISSACLYIAPDFILARFALTTAHIFLSL